MQASDFVEHREHEAIDESMQTLSILPCFDYGLGSHGQYTNQEPEPGPPHEALFLVLAYLPVFELLVMSETCISLRDAVNKDVLPWLDIIVERPLNSWLSDDILMKITSKANGRLRTLALINCVKITDDGLQGIIEKNPFISKLHVPACTGLTPEGIIKAVKTLSQHHSSLKSLWINSIYNIKREHLETLCSYLQTNPAQQKSQHVFYHHCRTSPKSRSKESDPMIDVEICPKCNEVRVVFDCSRKACKRKRDQSSTECRGCNFCIPRCEECGRCVDPEELEEVVCADILCSDCWLYLPKCNFCNKPYCKQHVNRQCRFPGPTGFVCDVCHDKASRNSNDFE